MSEVVVRRNKINRRPGRRSEMVVRNINEHCEENDEFNDDDDYELIKKLRQKQIELNLNLPNFSFRQNIYI